MNKRTGIVFVLFVLVGASLIAQDLTIDFQLNTRRADPRNNFFPFEGPIRYMAADRDQVDTTTGASRQMSTEKFQPYRYDVLGKNAFPDTLRDLFLYGVNMYDAMEADAFDISEDGGVITINYSHRGTAYQVITDRNGVVSLPAAQCSKRSIGYIQGGGPQVISTDFSSNGTAARIDWDKVWDSSVPGGKIVTAGVDRRTGDIVADVAKSDSMYYWEGELQFEWRRNILTVTGGLDAVAR